MGNAEIISQYRGDKLASEFAWKSKSFIFNGTTVSALTSRVVDALSLLSQQMEQVEQPFSGKTPKDLAQQFQSIDLEQPLLSFTESLKELKQLYLDDAVYFHQPGYMAHLNCPIVYPAIVAELILSSVNSSLDTWDQSAGGTLIEQSLIDWTIQKIGLGKNADGIFTSGGTQSNLMALLLARDHFSRYHLLHSIKQQGLPKEASRFRILTSEVSHFSVQKSAAILGLGYQSVISVATDDAFRMDTYDLQQKLIQCRNDNLIPVCVVATAGTTDFGSIDPLQDIADICQQQKLWFHVDAAYGCGLLISNQRRNKLVGIEQADSVTVDYHKSFFQPVSCGAFFVKDKHQFKDVTYHADYLNPLSQSQEGTPNLVNKSIQTTRRFDALKLWLSLRVIGAQQLGDYFDQVLDIAEQAYYMLDNEPCIEVLHKPELSALVFRYLPQKQSDYNHEIKSEIDTCSINEAIRKALFKRGEQIIASTKVNGLSYLKITLLNPQLELEQLVELIEIIKRIGNDLIKSFDAGESLESAIENIIETDTENEFKANVSTNINSVA
jgi:L-2,4-diaminobutyrate decarboxylase